MIGINWLLNPHHQNVSRRSHLAWYSLHYSDVIRQGCYKRLADPAVSQPSPDPREDRPPLQNPVCLLHFSTEKGIWYILEETKEP